MSEYLPLNHNTDVYLMVHAQTGASGVQLRVRGSSLGEGQYLIADETLRLRLVADLPDGQHTELGVVVHPYEITVPRSLLPAGGWVSLRGEVLTGTHRYKFRANPWHLGEGTSKVPSPGQRILSTQLDAGCADWLAVPQRYTHPDVEPYALKRIPSQNGVTPSGWVCERPWGGGAHTPGDFPRWRRVNGQVQPERIKKASVAGGGFLLGAAVDSKPYFPTYGGVPGITCTTSYGTVRGHPSGGHGPQWIELDGYGRFWGYNRDGSVTAMAGYRMPADPYEIPDETLSTWKTVGAFPDGPLKHPHDFAYDFVDRKYVYVADTGNDRLVRVSRHAAVVQGRREDFSKWVLHAWGPSFTRPTSVDTTTDGRVYVVDKQGLWSVSRDGAAKTLLQAHSDLFWVRCLSSGLVCTVDRTSTIYRIDPSSGQTVTLANIDLRAEWPLISPDLGGHIGPKDALYLINSPHYSYRIEQNGAVTGPMYFRGSSGSANVGNLRQCLEAFHYAWNCEVHQEEPYVFARSFNWLLPALFRPLQPSEAHLGDYDAALASRGRMIMRRGTVEGFPWGARPSFTALMSEHGYGGLGAKTFDQIQALPLAERMAYVKAGMGGSVPRPELVGEHLRSVLYWIWRNSSQFVAGQALDLPQPETDRSAPLVSNIRFTRSGSTVTWTWLTDRPSLCYVRFADRLPMYRWTQLESSFGTQHTATARHVDTDVHFQICALGGNGVLTETEAAYSGGGLDTTPPMAPTGLKAR